MKPADCARSSVPRETWRLIPSRFPPIGLFDTVSTVADLRAVMELEGWTNDRLVAERMSRIPDADWALNVPNTSVIMAAFLHAPPSGARFNGPELGAWYSAAAVEVSIAEVGHHLRREAVAMGATSLQRDFRAYLCDVGGNGHLDLRGKAADAPAILDPASHRASQAFGEEARSAGADGIVFDSLRFAGGTNFVAYRPRLIGNVRQERHVRLTVMATAPTILVDRLPA